MSETTKAKPVEYEVPTFADTVATFKAIDGIESGEVLGQHYRTVWAALEFGGYSLDDLAKQAGVKSRTHPHQWKSAGLILVTFDEFGSTPKDADSAWARNAGRLSAKTIRSAIEKADGDSDALYRDLNKKINAANADRRKKEAAKKAANRKPRPASEKDGKDTVPGTPSQAVAVAAAEFVRRTTGAAKVTPKPTADDVKALQQALASIDNGRKALVALLEKADKQAVATANSNVGGRSPATSKA